jgi:hypothetical protein
MPMTSAFTSFASVAVGLACAARSFWRRSESFFALLPERIGETL